MNSDPIARGGNCVFFTTKPVGEFQDVMLVMASPAWNREAKNETENDAGQAGG